MNNMEALRQENEELRERLAQLEKIRVDVTSANRLLTYKYHIATLKGAIEDYAAGHMQLVDLVKIAADIPSPFRIDGQSTNTKTK